MFPAKAAGRGWVASRRTGVGLLASPLVGIGVVDTVAVRKFQDAKGGQGETAGDGFPSNEVFAENRDDDIKEYAVFGDIAMHLNARWEVSAGLRASRGALDVSSLTTGVISGREDEIDLQNAKTSVTPRVAISFRPSDHLHLYAQAAKGFRIGGVNINTMISALFDPGLDPDEALKTQTFTEDSVWNYELGVKARAFDGRLETSLAGFYIKWDDIQTDQLLPTGFLFVTNAGNAKNYGVELQFAGQLNDRITVTAAAIWNDPHLVEGNGFLNAAKGDRLPAIASFTGGLSVAYEQPVRRGVEFAASADYTYVGSSSLFFHKDLSPRMGDFHRLGIRAGLQNELWQLALSVTNVFNTRGNTFAFGNSFSLNATSQYNPLRPRTMSLNYVRSF